MSLSLVNVVSLVDLPHRHRQLENGRRDADHEFGTNPCSEIILRDREFCNLTEVVVREE